MTISETNNALALVVFVLVAALVSSVVDLAARRTRQAARATRGVRDAGHAGRQHPARRDRAAGAAGTRARGVRPDLGHPARTDSAHRPGRGAVARGPADEWAVVASAGGDPCQRPQDADTEVPAGDTLLLALRGRPLRAEDQRLIGAFAAQAAVILERHRLSEAAAAAVPIAEGDRMRTALLAAVGHDLRTPLASAKAAVTSLRSNDIEWSAQDHDELLLTADESLDRLARLVDNLLDMSRLQAGALSVVSRSVALDEVRAAGAGRPRPGRAQTSSSTCPTTCRRCSPTPACSSGSSPTWSATRSATARPAAPPLVTGSSLGDRVELRVIDRGPGIPSAELDRVFAPVPAARRHRQHHRRRPRARPVPRAHRSHGRHAHAGGDPRRRAHDGGVAADRSLRSGTPAEQEPGRRERESARDESLESDHGAGDPVSRVLVVDDEPQILRALAINLRARHYEVFTAATGADALATAASHPPDLVILDLGLPDIDGIEVIRGLRGWSAAPIVVLSGRTDSADKVDALDAGADDYVTKPFGVDELLARMRAVSRRATPVDVQPTVTFGHTTVDLAGAPGHGPRRRPASSTCDSRRPSGTWWRCCCGTRASCSASVSCSPRCGGRATRRPAETCASTWPSCGASSRPTPRGPGTCSPSPAWATASSRTKRTRPTPDFLIYGAVPTVASCTGPRPRSSGTSTRCGFSARRRRRRTPTPRHRGCAS